MRSYFLKNIVVWVIELESIVPHHTLTKNKECFIYLWSDNALLGVNLRQVKEKLFELILTPKAPNMNSVSFLSASCPMYSAYHSIRSYLINLNHHISDGDKIFGTNCIPRHML